MFKHTGPRMSIDLHRVGVVITDLQNDFLSPGGGAYGLIERSLAANDTANNIERLLGGAKAAGIPIFISPHYYFPHDHKWTAPLTPLEDLAHEVGLVARRDPLSADGLAGSGADFPARYKPLLAEGDVVIASPHKAYGTSTNDLILQLRRRRIEQVVLAGPVGNLCVEAHMRDFIELGFEVAMVRDATAGAVNEEGDAYAAAMINWRFMAHALWSTRQTLKELDLAKKAAARASDTRSQAPRDLHEAVMGGGL